MLNNITLLLVEDEKTERDILKNFLVKSGYTVIEAEDGEQALEIFEVQKEILDLILLDIMMPKLSGWSVLKKIRDESKIPIAMITAKEEEEDELFGFELGADEYITKPYNLKIVAARINSLLKKVTEPKKGHKDYGEITIDFEGRVVFVENKKIDLPLREYDLLTYLVHNQGIALSRGQILNAVWNYNYYGDTRTIDNHIKKLRYKLGKSKKYIKTIRGVGYKFQT